jgi:hypothetical protein
MHNSSPKSGNKTERRKRDMKKYLITILVILLTIPTMANAFICGNNLASEGMSKYQILSNCGSPALKERVGSDYSNSSYRIIEKWLYVVNEYGNQQMYLIEFNGDGIAVKIDYIGKR